MAWLRYTKLHGDPDLETATSDYAKFSEIRRAYPRSLSREHECSIPSHVPGSEAQGVVSVPRRLIRPAASYSGGAYFGRKRRVRIQSSFSARWEIRGRQLAPVEEIES